MGHPPNVPIHHGLRRSRGVPRLVSVHRGKLVGLTPESACWHGPVDQTESFSARPINSHAAQQHLLGAMWADQQRKNQSRAVP